MLDILGVFPDCSIMIMEEERVHSEQKLAEKGSILSALKNIGNFKNRFFNLKNSSSQEGAKNDKNLSKNYIGELKELKID